MSPRVLLNTGVAALAFALGCSEDEKPIPPNESQVFRIPTEITFEDAVAQAGPGDTLLFLFSPLPLAETVTIGSSQTPLVLIGNKNYPTLVAPTDSSAIRFQSPKAGTRIEDLGFSGGSVTLDVTGPGAIEIRGCRFHGGQVQIRGTGENLAVTVTKSLFRSPGLYGLRIGSGTDLRASMVTVADAGDCGILITEGAQAHIQSSLVWRSANFGIACVAGGVYAADAGCNDVFLSGSAPYLNCVEPESDFHVDPLFCDARNGDFTVQSISPCAPANSGGCGQVGALLPGCEPPPPPPETGSPARP